MSVAPDQGNSEVVRPATHPADLEQAAEQRTSGWQWWPLVAVCLVDLMLLGDVGLVTVALPKVQAEFHAQLSGLQWVTNIYSMALAAFLLTAGTAADRWGRKPLLLCGLGIFLLAQLGNGLAPSTGFLIGTRLLEGVAAALMFSVSLVVLSETYRGRTKGVAFGVWGALTGSSIALGPIVGGILVESADWRWVFLIQLPVCLVTIAIVALGVPRTPPVGGRADWAGTVLFSIMLGLFVYTLVRGKDAGWTSAPTLAPAVATVVLFVIFVAVERRVREPMLDLSRFRIPAFSGAQVAAFTLGATHLALLMYLSLYLQGVLQYDALQAGMRLLPMNALTVLAALSTGRLVGRIGPRWPVAIGLALTGAGILLLRSVAPGSEWTTLLAGFVLIGFGGGMINPMLGALAMSVVTRRRAGMGSGISYTFRQLGIATGVAVNGAVFGAVINARLDEQLPGGSSHVADAVASGAIRPLLASVPEAEQPAVAAAAHSAFVAGLNGIFLVGGIVALVGAALVAVLVRPTNRQDGAPR
ncbi:MFS transporter [Kribbella solani]|uniref:EmrB/QacA subfamily drug resistance transporter n=1 Tax=Kribbella solani TaxID=236067 RepID=A0A841DQ66_9ACTN|nr:MFS transporter [Kribbella solani]MBB5980041.1 EmrB/QacA subfamily drug resistance transporter [Kribbella solani]